MKTPGQIAYEADTYFNNYLTWDVISGDKKHAYEKIAQAVLGHAATRMVISPSGDITVLKQELTKREQFAIGVLPILIQEGEVSMEAACAQAVKYADLLIAALGAGK